MLAPLDVLKRFYEKAKWTKKLQNDNKFAKVFNEVVFNEVKDVELDRMQCVDRLIHLLHYMLVSESLDGDVVEMGVYDGGTAMLMSLLTTKDVYLYDSFQGFPAKDTKGKESNGFVPFKFAITKDLVLEKYLKYDIKKPIIVSSYFHKLKKSDFPKKIAFAHLDSDIYQSMYDSLKLVYPLVSSGGFILIDDYLTLKWEGTTRAVEEFLSDKPEKIFMLPGSNGTEAFKGIIKKI